MANKSLNREMREIKLLDRLVVSLKQLDCFLIPRASYISKRGLPG